MIRSSDLPCLPGYCVDHHVGQSRFHLSNHFKYIHQGVPYLADKELPGIGGAPLPGSCPSRYPSIYVKGEVAELPAWIAFDKHILRFDAYWVEGAAFPEDNASYYVHKCIVYFFLEDGTIKVVEPPQRNSGLPQGCLVSRARIRLSPDCGSNDYYDIIDFNIGKEVTIYGKSFTLVNCDKFTRYFLNRMGIPVPDPIPVPDDHYMKKREKLDAFPIKAKPKKKDTINRFLLSDNRILGFKAYWDDRETLNGFVHLLKLSYFLVDDTIEVQDVTDPDNRYTIMKRCKLPKEYQGLPAIGDSEPVSLLNVVSTGRRKGPRYIVDPLGTGMEMKEYYTDKNLAIGAVLNSYGRRFVIYDCDNFTKDYYRTKFGLDDFTPAPRPPTKEESDLLATRKIEIVIPPHNGFGTYEDSVLNCQTVHPEALTKSYRQFYEKDRFGYDSKILRFLATMESSDPAYNGRKYIISYYLSDDTISVYDEVPANAGVQGGMLISRRRIRKGDRSVYSNKPPTYYTYDDLYIGAVVNLEKFEFTIVSADDYALRYMETHPNEFPKGNVRLILDRVRNAVRPTYKSFAAQFLVDSEFKAAPYFKFREAILKVIDGKISEHEILTLARYYSSQVPQEKFSAATIRRFTQDILKRELYKDFDQLREAFLYHDAQRQGYVCRKTAYCVLRGTQFPVDVELINLILEKLGKGPECKIYYDELIDFVNYQTHPVAAIQPVNISSTLSWQNLCRSTDRSSVTIVDINRFIKDLQLEDELKQQSA